MDEKELKLKRQEQAKKMRDAKEEKKGTIPVQKEFLEGLQKDIQRLQKDRDLLLSVADKSALARHYQRNQGDVPDIIKLRVIDNKVVIAWRSTKDDMFNVKNNDWVEDQRTELLFEGGKEKKEMRQKDFERIHTKTECKRLEVRTNTNGDTEFKLQRISTGKIYVVGAQFVN